MQIHDIQIDGFGVWNGQRLTRLDAQLNVFYGPNEAGKTTLMQFVRAMLYGLGDQRRQRYLPPVHGGRGGGALTISSPHGQLEVRRYFDNPQTDLQGTLRIVAPDGTLQGDHLLASLLTAIDERTFNHVFALGLGELQELATLDDSEAARLLYALASSQQRVSLAEIVRELGTARRRLWADEGQPSRIAQLVAQRQHLLAEIEQLDAVPQEYARLCAQRDKLEAELAELVATQTQLDQTAQLIDVAATSRERWQERAELQQQLAQLGEDPLLPVRMMQRYQTACRRLAEHRKGLADVRRRRKSLQRERQTLSVNQNFWREAPRIAALVEQRSWILGLERDAANARAEVAAMQRSYSADHAPSLAAESSSQRIAQRRLRPLAAALREAQSRRKQLADQAAQAQQTANKLGAELEESLASRRESDLTQALERTGTLASNLRRRVQLEQRLEQFEMQRTELREQADLAVDRQLLPAWVLTAVGAVFVLGVVLILAGLFLPGASSVGWAMALVGLVGGGGAIGFKTLLEGHQARQLDTSRKQLALAESQIQQTKQERETLDAELPSGGGPLLQRLSVAEKAHHALEELVPLEGRRLSAEREAAATAALAEQAASEYRAARRRWQDGLSAAGLPEDWTAAQVKSYLTNRSRSEDLGVELERLRHEAQRRERELEGVAARVDQLISASGQLCTEQGLSDRVDWLQRELVAQEKVAERRRALRRQWRQLSAQLDRHDRQIGRWSSRRQQVLRAAGVTKPSQLREREQRRQKIAALQTRYQALQSELALMLEPVGGESEVQAFLQRSGESHGEAYRHELQLRRNELTRTAHSLAEQRGRLLEQIATVANDRRGLHRRLELQQVEAQLEIAAEQWQVFATAQQLIATVRRRYETQRQPEVLQQASHYLRQLTEGHYQRVWTPIDESVLRVDTREGESLEVESLSRGTREQLFLSLRLAIVDLYRQRGAQLPLVLDDVLVNFDTHRGRAAAEVLKAFAATGIQVLVFTCHEHIAEMFQSLEVPTRRLPVNLGRAAQHADFPRRRVRAKPPEPVVELETPVPVKKAKPPVEIEAEAETETETEPTRPAATPSMRRRMRRQLRRQRSMLRSQPFADTVWHDPVEDEIEIAEFVEEPGEPEAA